MPVATELTPSGYKCRGALRLPWTAGGRTTQEQLSRWPGAALAINDYLNFFICVESTNQILYTFFHTRIELAAYTTVYYFIA